MNYATIGPISVYLPERCETIDDLKKEHPEWELDEICAKTGVYARYISAPDEFASDMAVKAAAQLLEEAGVEVRTAFELTGIKKGKKGVFQISPNKETLHSSSNACSY